LQLTTVAESMQPVHYRTVTYPYLLRAGENHAVGLYFLAWW